MGLVIFKISCRSLDSSSVASVSSRLVRESRLGVERSLARRISLEVNRLELAGDFNDRNTLEVGVGVVGDKVAERRGGVPTRRRLLCLVGVCNIPLMLLVLEPVLDGVRGPNDFSLNRLVSAVVKLMLDKDDDDVGFRGSNELPLEEVFNFCKLLLEFLGEGGGNREVVLVAMFL